MEPKSATLAERAWPPSGGLGAEADIHRRWTFGCCRTQSGRSQPPSNRPEMAEADWLLSVVHPKEAVDQSVWVEQQGWTPKRPFGR
jgi:hypothetical protein